MTDSESFHGINDNLQQSQDSNIHIRTQTLKVKLNSKVLLQVTRGGKVTKETYKLSESNPDMQEDICTFGSPLGSLIRDQPVGFSGSYSVASNKTDIIILKIN